MAGKHVGLAEKSLIPSQARRVIAALLTQQDQQPLMTPCPRHYTLLAGHLGLLGGAQKPHVLAPAFQCLLQPHHSCHLKD